RGDGEGGREGDSSCSTELCRGVSSGSADISAAGRISHAASVATVFVGRGQARSESRILLPQVELSNLMYTKKDLQYAICRRRPYRDPLAWERFTQRQRVAFVADRSIDADLAYRVGRA